MRALERLFQGLPDSAIKPRASITIELAQLAAQLARVDQTLEQLTASITTSQDTTHSVMVVLQQTIQTTIAPLSALKDNLEHLHQKMDSLENTIDERLPSGTHVLNAGHINDRTGLANAGAPDDTDQASWATPDFPLMMMLQRLPLQLMWLLSLLLLLMALLTS
jgi:ABC-type transporter Mla subunit MlaD